MPRVLDWIDPGNAGGSVLIPDAPASHPVDFICRLCGLSFSTELNRTNHVHEYHPLIQPTMTFNEVPVTRRTVVRRTLSAGRVAFESCTDIVLTVNGGREKNVTSQVAAAVLSRREPAYISLLLRNAQAETQYEIRIAIPREEDLDKVDDSFRSYLAHDDVTLADVDRFGSATAHYPASEDYASALADYVIGVLIKDQTGGTSLAFPRYRDKLQAAAGVLHEFSARRLPRAILHCIRFNLNEFPQRREHCGIAMLDDAMSYYGGMIDRGALLTKRRREGETSPRLALCPVDESTALLTATLSAGVSQSTPSDSVILELEARGATALTSDPDKVKLYVVIADVWLARGERGRAVPYLRRLEHDYNFGKWASHALGVESR